MKKSELRFLVRGIVREEVALAIKEVINELKQPTQQISQPKSKTRIEDQKNFSNNSILNEVLNETAEASEEWKSMGGGTYDSSRTNEVIASQYKDVINNDGNVNPEMMVASMGVNPETAPDPIKNMFKKDYRSILKKVDEKAKQHRG